MSHYYTWYTPVSTAHLALTLSSTGSPLFEFHHWYAKNIQPTVTGYPIVYHWFPASPEVAIGIFPGKTALTPVLSNLSNA